MTRLAVWVPGAVLALGLGALLLCSLFQAQAQTFDTLLYARSLWGVAHGEPVNSVVGVHALSIHGHFVLYALAPLAWYLPSASVLVIAQVAAFFATIVLTAAAVRRVALEHGATPRGGALSAVGAAVLVTIGSPLVLNPFLFDARPDLIAVPLCLAGLLRAERKQGLDAGAVAWLFAAAVLVREEFAMVIVGAALALPGSLRRPARAIIALAAVTWWFVYWFELRELFGGSEAVARVETTPAVLLDASIGARADWIANLVLYKGEILLSAALGLGGFALAGGRLWGAAVPGLLFVLVNNRYQHLVLNFHYSMFAAPGLIAAAVAGFRAYARRGFPDARKRAGQALLAGLVLYAISAAGPGGRRFRGEHFDPGQPGVAQAHALLARIPPQAGASLPYMLAAPLADRREIRDAGRLADEALGRGVPPDLRYVGLLPRQWRPVGRWLVEREGFEIVDAVRGSVALLTRDPIPPAWENLARVDPARCAAPRGRWPAAGLALCEADRAPDWRAAVVVLRYAPAAPEHAGRKVHLGFRQGAALLALGGLVNLRGLPVGRAVRLLADAPKEPFAGEVQLYLEGHGLVPAQGREGIPVSYR